MTEFDPAEDPKRFRDTLGSYATGVTVITTDSDDGPVGITANSFASVSLDPPLVLWMPAKTSNRFKYFESAKYFAVHVLLSHQENLAMGFTKTHDNFDGSGWKADPNGTPLLPSVLARFDCEFHNKHDAGDHIIILGRVVRAVKGSGDPLVFQGGAFL